MPLHKDDPKSVGGYKLVDRLGSGGMGVVYRGRSRSGRDVAVKVVHAQYATDAVFRTRFRQEVAACRRVSGAFTAPVVDADPEAELPWMATQYVPGRSLADRIRADGPLQGAELRRLVLGLVEALRDIHRAGVVHRDLKPANVMMAEDGPRVIDFGISRAAGDLTLTETGHLMGTPPFMSPEQLVDARSVGPASDVFSLGALVVFAATGRGPFDTDSPYLTAYRVVSEEPELDALSPPLRAVVSRCLAKEPAARPGPDELAHAFVTALPDPAPDDMPTVPQRRPDPQPTMPPAAGPEPAEPPTERTRNRRTPVLVAAAGVLVIGLMAYFLGPLRGGGAAEAGPSPSASAGRWAALPAGWRPWQTTLYATAARGVKQAPAADTGGNGSLTQPSCMQGGGSVYCSDDGALPVRIDASTGRTNWRAALPPDTPIDRYGARVVGVRDDVLLVQEAVSNAAANDTTDTVSAFATDSGRRLWSRAVEGRYADAALVGGLVLVPNGSVVTARSAQDGTKRWTMTLPADHRCTFLADGDRPYADCSDRRSISDQKRVLLAVDPADGSVRRLRSAPSAEATYTGILDGRLVFVERRTSAPTAEGNDYARAVLIDPADGRARTTELAQEQQGWPALVHGVLCFVTSSGRMTGVSPLTGKRLWQTATTLEQPGTPVADGRRSVFVSNASGRVAALDARSGTLLWESRPRADRVYRLSGPIPGLLLHQGALLVPSPDGTLFTLDPAHPERKPVSG
ncbi:PQQ-binding-like beta-propeller repeat protein [Streptomyces sp. NPDC001137]|uniref:protein kinase domain-containing protein n=1 Tax=Streptomyces sp. NPDC001137 TaxID=3154378 RepID=UPI00332BB579